MTTPLRQRPKRAWPLVTLAATSFIPGLGILLGSAAVTWGLVTDRPRARLAIGLGAAGALLQLAGAVTLTIWTRDSESVQTARTVMVANELTAIVVALDDHRAKAGRYPATLRELVGYPVPMRFINVQDQFGGVFKLRPYEYHVAPDGLSFDLFSVGPDREPGTGDDVRPLLPDSLRSRSGYRPPP